MSDSIRCGLPIEKGGPMTREKLQQRLVAAKIRAESYSLSGGQPSEAYCLERFGGGWATYYSERGQRTGEQFFATEDAACRHLLAQLLDDPTTRLPQ